MLTTGSEKEHTCKTGYQEGLIWTVFFALSALDSFTVPSLVTMPVEMNSSLAPKKSTYDDPAPSSRDRHDSSHPVIFAPASRYMATTAHLILLHFPRTYAVCPSIAANPSR